MKKLRALLIVNINKTAGICLRTKIPQNYFRKSLKLQSLNENVTENFYII